MSKGLRCALAVTTVYLYLYSINLAFSCSKVANLEQQLTRLRCEYFSIIIDYYKTQSISRIERNFRLIIDYN